MIRKRTRGVGDAGTSVKVEQILRDPSGYYAHARQLAHEQARRLVAEQLALISTRR